MISLNSFQDDFEPEQEDDFEPEQNQENFIKQDLREAQQRGLQYSPEERRKMATEALQEYSKQKDVPGFLKELIHSATLGGVLSTFTSTPEEEKETFGKELGRFAGSTIPLEGMTNFFGGKLVNLASKSPIFKRALKGLAGITGMGITGASETALESLTKGEILDIDDVAEHGLQWSALDATLKSLGLSGRFAKALISKTSESLEPVWKILNKALNKSAKSGELIDEKITKKVLNELEKINLPPTPRKTGQPPPLPKKYEFKAEPIHKVSEESPSLAEPYKLGEFKAENIDKKIIEEEQIRFSKELEDVNKETEKLLNEISPRRESKKELGQNIQNSVEKYIEEAEKIYKPKYEESEEIQKVFNYQFDQTAAVTKNLIKNLSRFKTKPQGYNEVIEAAKNILSDLGYTKTAKIGGETFELSEPIMTKITVSEANEIAKRLNQLSKYDIIGSDIRKQLHKITHSLKEEIHFATELANEKAGKAFKEAETKFGETARNLKREFIHKVRGEEASEKIISNAIKSPTALQDLKQILHKKEYAALEREVLEHVKSLSHEKAKNYLREFKPILSEKSKNIGEKIIENKEKISLKPKKKELTKSQLRKDAIEKDLEIAFEEGKKPKKTLSLWETKEGQKLVKEALEGNPHKKEILEYLEKQHFHDFISSVIEKDGKINFKKFNEYLKDPALTESIKLLGGPNALSTFKTLESMAKKMELNKNIFDKLQQTGAKISKPLSEKGKRLISRRKETNVKYLEEAEKKSHPVSHIIKELDKFLGKGGKTLLYALGIGGIAIKPTVAYLASKGLIKLIENPRVRNAFIKAANANPHNLTTYIRSFEELSKVLNEED